MSLKEFKNLFSEQLLEIYPKTEIDTFFFLLIEEYLGLERIDVILKADYKIDEQKLSILKNVLKRLKKEEPIQYIIGKTEFYGNPFFVDKNTLIPRPETEELVAWIINEVEGLKQDVQESVSILDVGTGTGCIPISLAKNLLNATIAAIDISADALQVANKNADLNNVSINFLEIDILNAPELPRKYDVIMSNPPYVREQEKAEIQNNVLQNEPHLAIFVSDDDPLIFYRKIADLAKNHLSEKGILFFEINQYLGKETCNLLKQIGFKSVELRKDLFQNDRMIKAKL